MAIFLIVIILFLLLPTEYCDGLYNEQSIEYYNRALKIHNNDRHQSIQHYNLALEHFWEFPEAHQNLAIEYEYVGQIGKARDHHEYSFRFARNDDFQIGALNNLIQFEMKLERVPPASKILYWIDLCDQALLGYPNHTETLFTKGRLFSILGQDFRAAKIFEEIVRIDPNHIRAIMNVGNYFFNLRNYPRACEIYEHALSVASPTDSLSIVTLSGNLAQSYRERGSLWKALSYLQLSYQHGASAKSKLWTLITMYAVKGLLCNWKEYELLEELITYQIQGYMSPELAGALLVNHGDTADAIFDPYTLSLLRYVNQSFDLWVVEKSCPLKPFYSYPLIANRSEKLKIGYLSYDWRNHPMGRLTSSLITNYLSKNIEIYCFCYGENDESFIRHYVAKYCDHFVDLYQLKYDYNASDIIHSFQVDMLIDITTHTYNNRIGISCLKPAPIIVNYLGYPGSTGCTGFDFTIVDYIVAPIDQSSFSEKLVYLPFSYQSNYMPLHISPRTADVAKVKASSPSLNICIFNANKKFEPLSFQAWMNILQRIPYSNMYFLDIADEVQGMLLQYGYMYGINAKKRFTFLSRIPWEEHLQRAAEYCDVALDNFIYGAHTTASDLLWMGIPIVTLRGYGQNRMPGRIPSSIISNIIPVELDEGETSSWSDNYKHIRSLAQQLSSVLIHDHVHEYEDILISMSAESRRMKFSTSNTSTSMFNYLKHILNMVVCYSPTFHRELMAHEMNYAYEVIAEGKLFSEFTYANDKKLFNFLLLPTYFMKYGTTNFCQRDSLKMLQVMNENRTLADTKLLRIFDWNGQFSSATNISSVIRRLKSSLPNSLTLNDYQETISILHTMESDTLSNQLRIELEAQLNELKKFDSEKLNELFISLVSNWTQETSPEQLFREELFSSYYQYLLNSNATLAIIVLQKVHVSHLMSMPQFEERLFQIVIPLLLLPDVAQRSPVNISVCTEEAILSQILQTNNSYDTIYGTTNTSESLYPAILFRDYFPCVLNLLFQNSFSNLPQFRFNHLQNARPLRDIVAEYIFQHVLLIKKAAIKDDQTVWRNVIYWSIVSYYLEPENHQRLMNIGVLLMESKVQSHVYGYYFAELATILIHAQRKQIFQAYLEQYGKDHQFTMDELSVSNYLPENLEKKQVAIYCYEYGQAWWPGWGPQSFYDTKSNRKGQAVGGSEEAVYYLSVELTKLGFDVIIYGDIIIEDRGHSSKTENGGTIVWLHYLDFDPFYSWPIFISWRYSLSLSLSHNAQQSYLWLHDLISWSSLLPLSLIARPDSNDSTWIKGILVQSQFHQEYLMEQFALLNTHQIPKDELMKLLVAWIQILPNGVPHTNILLDSVNTNNNNHNNNSVFVYGSSPSRGLEYVLTMWPRIKHAIPSATLHVYYGFTEKVIEHLRKELGMQRFQVWFDLIRNLLQQDGVIYHGPVDHEELTDAFQQGGFLLYPTKFPETGCITMIRAMIAGMIPITSWYQSSVLRTLGEEFDLGPSTVPLLNAYLQNDELFRIWLQDYWTPSVITAYNRPAEELLALRIRMKQYMREKYSWQHSAMIFSDIVSH